MAPLAALIFGLVVGWLLAREYYRSVTK